MSSQSTVRVLSVVHVAIKANFFKQTYGAKFVISGGVGVAIKKTFLGGKGRRGSMEIFWNQTFLDKHIGNFHYTYSVP